MSKKINAQKTKFEIATTDTGTADTQITGVASFNGFDGEASEIDTTDLESEAKEFELGLRDNGAFNLEIHPDYTDAGQVALRAAGRESREFKVTLSNNITFTFRVLVKNADAITGGVDAIVTGTVATRITGAIVRGVAA